MKEGAQIKNNIDNKANECVDKEIFKRTIDEVAENLLLNEDEIQEIVSHAIQNANASKDYFKQNMCKNEKDQIVPELVEVVKSVLEDYEEALLKLKDR